MKIAFVTTCKGRTHHLARTLPQNLKDNEDYPDAIFIVLNYGSPDGLMDYLFDNYRKELDAGRLAVYTAPNAGPFRMAHAKNMAHRLGIFEGAQILCNLDADNMTGPGFATFIANHFQTEGMDTFLWGRMEAGKLPRGISGRIVVPAQTFLKAGGYDEQLYEDWGPDDKDFNARLARAGYRPFEIPWDYLKGIRHDDRIRFKEYPHKRPDPEDSSELPVDHERPRIANHGNIGCGVVKWNFSRLTIPLLPMATRIWGIGMHKTGTCSLARALTVLGIDTAHWISPRWARNIWEEMEDLGESVTLEKHYAATDLPIPLLYKELDRAYPGSKFILTVRAEAEWLESVKRHWSDKNPYKETWKHDAFTKKVHSILYNQNHFDKDIMVARYRRHNHEVMQYFRHRPRDLLVLDMSWKAIWPKLSNFLGVITPGVPYPKENVTEA